MPGPARAPSPGAPSWVRRWRSPTTTFRSINQLTIEKGTPFWRERRDGALTVPDDDSARALFDLTQEATAEAGFAAYEVSNHGREGDACRHNLAYWRYDDYVGIGPGAHGRIQPPGGTRQHAAPESWLAAVERSGHGTAERRAIGVHEQAREMLMMGLRLTEGVSTERLRVRTGCDSDRVIDRAGLDRLVAAGYLERSGGRLWATAVGRPLLNRLLVELLV